MKEITIKLEEDKVPDECLMRIRLAKKGDWYIVFTEQSTENVICPWWEKNNDWRTCVWTNHKTIESAMREYAQRLESLKTRGF